MTYKLHQGAQGVPVKMWTEGVPVEAEALQLSLIHI